MNDTVQDYDQDSMNNDPDQPVKMETFDLFPDENKEKIVVDKKSDNLSNMTLQQFKDCRFDEIDLSDALQEIVIVACLGLSFHPFVF